MQSPCFQMFFIPLDPVNLFADSEDTKQSSLDSFSRSRTFITKWHKGDIWGLGGKRKMHPHGGRSGMSFSLPSPRIPIKLYLLLVSNHNTLLNFLPECKCPSRYSRNQPLSCVCPHLCAICLILLVSYHLRCPVIWTVLNYAGFWLPSWWSTIYLLGLSWETICSRCKIYNHFVRTIFNWGDKNN